jgi:hypothetical protein
MGILLSQTLLKAHCEILKKKIKEKKIDLADFLLHVY